MSPIRDKNAFDRVTLGAISSTHKDSTPVVEDVPLDMDDATVIDGERAGRCRSRRVV